MDDAQSMEAILRRIRERYDEDREPEAARSPGAARVIEPSRGPDPATL
jgi:hypothetical protein